MIEGVLFDAGNTLIKMEQDTAEILYEIIEDPTISIEEVYTAYKKSRSFYRDYYNEDMDHKTFWSAFIQSALENLGIEEKRGEEFYEIIAEKTEFVPYPETSEVLSKLSKDYSLGIVSNWDLELSINDVLEDLELKEYFSSVISSSDIKILKPDPQIFLEALRRLDLKPHQCFYIGDELYEDIHGARNVGLIPILIDREGNYRETDCPKIENLKGIYTYLERDKFL
ncbi:MAG: HAD-IA family hydrolase [Euryarchaeota archaeon]|nr:HAD-IA family hydrolase [Euryarchaeota archaeon]